MVSGECFDLLGEGILFPMLGDYKSNYTIVIPLFYQYYANIIRVLYHYSAIGAYPLVICSIAMV